MVFRAIFDAERGHSMGEAKRKALARQKNTVALDTFGGRIPIHCKVALHFLVCSVLVIYQNRMRSVELAGKGRRGGKRTAFSTASLLVRQRRTVHKSTDLWFRLGSSLLLLCLFWCGGEDNKKTASTEFVQTPLSCVAAPNSCSLMRNNWSRVAAAFSNSRFLA